LYCFKRSVLFSKGIFREKEGGTNPNITVVPLSVIIHWSFTITFPSYATSIKVLHSKPVATGPTLSGPSNLSSATYPKYCTPVPSVW
jgi:hypothetical protein